MFMCQREPFLKKFETEVVSCEPVNENDGVLKELVTKDFPKNGSADGSYFKIVLKDTILFPEGGGQPDDRGCIGASSVVRVIRDGTTAVNYVVAEPPKKDEALESADLFKVGERVETKVDWGRRFDHMQQHSGQHLITAIADSLFGYSTTSWWLGREESYIELDCKEVKDSEMCVIEETVNRKIFEAAPVHVDVVELDDPKLKSARGRNLPEDVKGQIRIVTMEGVESNVCCGTHVSNLSQLQVVKLLRIEKKKGRCLLFFLCGNRVTKKFSEMYNREQKLMTSLKTNPENFLGAADKINLQLRTSKKMNQTLCKDLASLEAEKIKMDTEKKSLCCYHRENVDVEFGMNLLREIGESKCSILITLKVDGNNGHVFFRSGQSLSDELTSLITNKLCNILDGKGAIRGSTFQAKVNKINLHKKAVSAVNEILSMQD